MTLPAATASKNDNKSSFSNPIELPSMEIAYAEDRAKEEAFQALEIFKDGKYQYVRCQNPSCGKAVRIVGKMERPKSDRIEVLLP